MIQKRKNQNVQKRLIYLKYSYIKGFNSFIFKILIDFDKFLSELQNFWSMEKFGICQLLQLMFNKTFNF